MIKKPLTSAAIFVLLIASVGVHQNIDIWVWESFIFGFCSLIIVPTIWLKNRSIGTFLGVLGFLMLILISVIDLSVDRVFFSGAIWGFVFGGIPAYFLNRPKSYEVGLAVCRVDGYCKLESYFEEKLNTHST
jgi:hypothetical protein